MPVFVAKEFTATLAGRRLEAVTCEKCGTRFFYELTRVGVGKGSAPYLLGQGAASNRAAGAAERDLAERLGREAELVPCPKCHWVNQDLVERYRQRQYRRAPLLIAIIAGAGIVAGPIVAFALTEFVGYNSRLPSVVSMAILAASLSTPAWVLLVRRRLRQRIDPNATHPRRPTVPPGTPPALVETRDARTGEARLVPIARRGDDAPGRVGGRPAAAEWAVFRPGQVRFPPVCCVCLAPASTVFASPFKPDENSEVEVPLCAPCDAGLRRRWWLVLLGAAGLAVAVVGVVAFAIPGIDAFGRWALFILFGSIGALVGGVVSASVACRPYRMSVVDADRGIVRFAASNPDYTALLVEQVRISEGLAAR